jgi:hypothetical protein
MVLFGFNAMGSANSPGSTILNPDYSQTGGSLTIPAILAATRAMRVKKVPVSILEIKPKAIA